MAGLPRLVRPMLATVRHDLPAGRDRYGWEFKWAGVRAGAYVRGDQVRLPWRNDKDMTAGYPELAVLAERAGTPVILDGEIVALRGGRPDFGALQKSRMHLRRPPARADPGHPGAAVPVRPAAPRPGLAAGPALHRPGNRGGWPLEKADKCWGSCGRVK